MAEQVTNLSSFMDDEISPCEHYFNNTRYRVKLYSSVQYSEWIEVIEEATGHHQGPWAFYTDKLETYEPYLNMSDTEKNEFNVKVNNYIKRLVKVSISKRLADKLRRRSFRRSTTN